MFLLVIRWIVLWLVYLLLFAAVGAGISIVATGIASRRTPASDMEGLGGWIVPMLLFWALCAIAAIIVVARDHSFSGLLNALAIFLPGILLGSASVFMTGPLWLSRGENSSG